MHTNHVDDIAHDSQTGAVVMQNNDPIGGPNHGQPTIQQLMQNVQAMGLGVTQMQQELAHIGQALAQIEQALALIGRIAARSANRQAYTGQWSPYTAVPNLKGEYPATAPNFLPIMNLAVIEAAEGAQLCHWELFYFGAESDDPLPARRLRIAQEVGVNGLITTNAPMLH